MDTMVLRRIGWVSATLGLTTALVGCAELTANPAATEEGAALALTNGLANVNGLANTNGLAGTNGLANTNGLALTNGLAGTNGLAATNGLMTTDGGRKTVAYLVKCALVSGDTLVKQDQNGANYTFSGGLGLCPQWKTGAIDGNVTCQEAISACIMAHVNAAGIHYPIWVDAADNHVNWGLPASNYKQEGTFMGNIMVTGNMTGKSNFTAPKGFYCEGQGFSDGVVAGRVGTTNTGVYTLLSGSTHSCNALQGVSNYGPGGNAPQTCYGHFSNGWFNGNMMNTPADGFEQCSVPSRTDVVFQNNITVWRDPNAFFTFDSGYWYSFLAQNGSTGKALDNNGSTNNDTQFVQWGYNSTNNNQQFQVTTGATSGSYMLRLKNNTNKCMDNPGGYTANGTKVRVWDCNTSSVWQQWMLTNDPATGSVFMKNVGSGKCLDNSGSTSDGANPWIWDCNNTNNNQRWQVRAR
jgi:hypothetical protein